MKLLVLNNAQHLDISCFNEVEHNISQKRKTIGKR
jgi:hypothetical protein